MIKAKDEWNEWREQRQLKIDEAVLFAGWLSERYGLSEKGLHGNIEKFHGNIEKFHGNIEKWKEQLK